MSDADARARRVAARPALPVDDELGGVGWLLVIPQLTPVGRVGALDAFPAVAEVRPFDAVELAGAVGDDEAPVDADEGLPAAADVSEVDIAVKRVEPGGVAVAGEPFQLLVVRGASVLRAPGAPASSAT
jgi:hypothetical protein